jgi:hypothetical protein
MWGRAASRRARPWSFIWLVPIVLAPATYSDLFTDARLAKMIARPLVPRFSRPAATSGPFGGDVVRLQPVPRLRAREGSGRRVQREIHGEPVLAAWRLVPDPAGHVRSSYRNLFPASAVGVFRASFGTGRLIAARGSADIGRRSSKNQAAFDTHLDEDATVHRQRNKECDVT